MSGEHLSGKLTITTCVTTLRKKIRKGLGLQNKVNVMMGMFDCGQTVRSLYSNSLVLFSTESTKHFQYPVSTFERDGWCTLGNIDKLICI